MAVRKTFVALVAVTCLALLAQGAMADFTYLDFTSTAGLSLNGAATAPGGGVVLVNPESNDVRGSIYHTTRQDISGSGGFTTTFNYTITNTGGTPGDGMAFIIQDASAGFVTTAGGGSGMGFQGVNPGVLAIEFDTFGDIGFTGVTASGSYASQLLPNSAGGPAIASGVFAPGGATSPGLADNSPHTAVITYDGVGKLLDLKIDGSSPWNGTVSVDLSSYLAGDGKAFVGFSGGTGGANEEHKLNSWVFSETGAALPPPPPPNPKGWTVENIDGTGVNPNNGNFINMARNPPGTATILLGETDVVNYGDGSNGQFGGDYPFLNEPGDKNSFLQRHTGFVFIPTAGAWSLQNQADDPFYVEIGTDSGFVSWTDTGCCNNQQTVRTLDAGWFPIEVIMAEFGGGDNVEFSMAFGEQSPGAPLPFNTATYHLVGDVNNGGLMVSQTIIPEPSTLLIWALGLLAVAWNGRRHRRVR